MKPFLVVYRRQGEWRIAGAYDREEDAQTSARAVAEQVGGFGDHIQIRRYEVAS